MNRQIERNFRWNPTFVWAEGLRKSILDLTITHRNITADLEVSQVRDFT